MKAAACRTVFSAIPASTAFLSAALLSACAAVEPAAAERVAAAGTAEPAPGGDAAITGSRIPSRRTEKMVSQVGARDYKESRQAAPAPLQIP